MRGVAITEAVAVSCGRGEQEKSGLAQAIELAMAQTIQEAYEEGLVGDTEEIRKRMQATRGHVKAKFANRGSNLEG